MASDILINQAFENLLNKINSYQIELTNMIKSELTNQEASDFDINTLINLITEIELRKKTLTDLRDNWPQLPPKKSKNTTNTQIDADYANNEKNHVIRIDYDSQTVIVPLEVCSQLIQTIVKLLEKESFFTISKILEQNIELIRSNTNYKKTPRRLVYFLVKYLYDNGLLMRSPDNSRNYVLHDNVTLNDFEIQANNLLK
jgi:hypothetical protein